MRSPPPPLPSGQPFNQASYLMQQTIEQKLQKAITEKAKVKLEDVIEESNMPGPEHQQREDMNFLINSLGRNNFG